VTLIKRRGVVEATPHRPFSPLMVTRFVERNAKWRRRNGARSRACASCALVGREGRKDVVTLSAVRLTPVAAPPIVGQTRGDRPKKSRDRCEIYRPPGHVLRQTNIFRHSQPLNRFRAPPFAFCRSPTRIGGDRWHSTLRFSLVSRSCHRRDARDRRGNRMRSVTRLRGTSVYAPRRAVNIKEASSS